MAGDGIGACGGAWNSLTSTLESCISPGFGRPPGCRTHPAPHEMQSISQRAAAGSPPGVQFQQTRKASPLQSRHSSLVRQSAGSPGVGITGPHSPRRRTGVRPRRRHTHGEARGRTCRPCSHAPRARLSGQRRHEQALLREKTLRHHEPLDEKIRGWLGRPVLSSDHEGNGSGHAASGRTAGSSPPASGGSSLRGCPVR